MKKMLFLILLGPGLLHADGIFEINMTDKEVHFCFGAFCAYSFLLVDNLVFFEESQSPLRRATVGFLGAAAGGGLKELWDSTGRGTVDLQDFWATLAGGSAAVAEAISADCLANQSKTWYSILYGGTAVLFAIPVGVYAVEHYAGI
jgi:hypothetical protein